MNDSTNVGWPAPIEFEAQCNHNDGTNFRCTKLTKKSGIPFICSYSLFPDIIFGLATSEQIRMQIANISQYTLLFFVEQKKRKRKRKKNSSRDYVNQWKQTKWYTFKTNKHTHYTLVNK